MRRAALICAAGLLVAAALVGPAQAGGGNKVRVDNYDYSPKRIKINKGDKVTWVNKQGTHSVTFKGSKYDKVLTPSDPRASKKFRKKGKFRYFCKFHTAQGQKGKVIVR